MSTTEKIVAGVVVIALGALLFLATNQNNAGVADPNQYPGVYPGYGPQPVAYPPGIHITPPVNPYGPVNPYSPVTPRPNPYCPDGQCPYRNESLDASEQA
ncbi:MAG: hypothetical protein AAF539_06220 [Planctomycetota bacterium]